MTETTETPAAPAAPVLYDLLLVAENPAHRVAPKGGESFLRFMAVGKMLRVTEESVADQWVEVYGEPDVSSHELFVIGAAPDGDVPFVRATVRFGLEPVALPFGDGRETNFFVELTGTPYTDLVGRFKNKFKDILLARPIVFSRPHEPVRPNRVVGEDERPKTREKRERGTAKAGTRVEEF